MKWPWSKTENRDAGGGYTDTLVRLIEAQAAGTAADTGSTAAVEAASGALSRAFSGAKVEGPEYVRNAVTGVMLGQVGRDLVRIGESLHVIDMRGDKVILLPATNWHFTGGADPGSWMIEATVAGPSTTDTRKMPYEGVVHVRWGSSPGRPYSGRGPLSWAHTTARLGSETERSLADELRGPLAQLLTLPKDGGDDSLDELRSDIGAARGKGVFVETTARGYGEGPSAAPQRDWVPQRLGPNPTTTTAQIQKAAFEAVLAACGTPPSLFLDADGTAARESLRRWHLNLVLPLARLVEDELSRKLEADVGLTFDSYALDMVSRASVVDKLVRAGVPTATALAAVGLED